MNVLDLLDNAVIKELCNRVTPVSLRCGPRAFYRLRQVAVPPSNPASSADYLFGIAVKVVDDIPSNELRLAMSDGTERIFTV